MTITLDNVGKRYGREWIFRKLNYQFSSGKTYAILGPNGSGKSTLLQVLACNQSPTEGSVIFLNNESEINAEDVFSQISLCAPYLQLLEEFTLEEQLAFHFSFKKALSGFTQRTMIELLGMKEHSQKQIRYFSSGMKQRVKLCLSILTNVPVLLLDEPATNLDENGLQWYKQLLQHHLNGRLLIICSNRNEEYEMCGEKIRLQELKG